MLARVRHISFAVFIKLVALRHGGFLEFHHLEGFVLLLELE